MDKDPKVPSPLEMRKDRMKQNLKAIIEHARGIIQTSVFSKDQVMFLDPIDKLQSMVIQESREADTIQKSILLMKDTARRVLRPNPAKMSRILNELDAIEQGTTEFFSALARIPRR